MKVLLISNMYPTSDKPYYGTFVKNSHQTLLNNGLDVDLISVCSNFRGRVGKVLSYFIFYINIIYKIIFYKYDYLYVHYVSHCALPIILCSYFKKSKIVSHVHGGDIKLHTGRSKLFFYIKRMLSTKLLKMSYKVIVPSDYYKQYVLDNFANLDIVVYPSGGVDIDIFHSKRLPKTDVVNIGYAGRLDAAKRVDWVIEIYAKLVFEYPQLKLFIVGNGSEKVKLQLMVQDLGLTSNVVFHDAKSQQKLADWYREIDLIIYPSESESLGLVPLEAMSCGVIPFLSDIPAFREFINKDNGFVCCTKKSFVRDIKKILSGSVSEVKLLSENTSKFVHQKYSSITVSKVLLNVFK